MSQFQKKHRFEPHSMKIESSKKINKIGGEDLAKYLFMSKA